MSTNAKTSIHIKPCNIAQSEAHNRRDKDYLKALDPKKIYIRTDLTHKNESYVSPIMNGKTLQEYYVSQKAVVKELTGRAMQEKDVEYTDKNGKKRVRHGSSPLREGVAVVEENTTMDDLKRFTDAVQERWDIRAIQIHIHRDEGHYENSEEKTGWKPNYHAHIVWDWINPFTGKSYKLSKADMSKMQDLLAEILKMQRGQKKSETGLEHLERNEFIQKKQEAKNQALKEETDKLADTLNSICKAMDIKEEEFFVHELATDPLVDEAREAIKKELDIPIPMLGKDEWKAERKKAVKKILTDLQTKLMEAKATQKEEILRAGKALYKQTKKDIADKIEQNRILHEANEKLTAENTRLKEKLASVDETAVRRLQAECESANRRAERADRIATGERRRASDAEEKVHDMLAIPEIKEIWETIRRNKESFQRQINQWITDATKAISDFAKDYDKYLFSQDDESVIGSGIIAEAYMCGLDPTDKDQRTQATESLLGKVNWKGTTPFMSDLAATRTKQLSEEMNVPREIMEGLMLAAGGRGGANMGGGGSNNELTNWDGTKRNKGWGRNREGKSNRKRNCRHPNSDGSFVISRQKPKNLLGIQPHPPECHIALDQVRPVHIHLFTREYQLVLAALLHIVPCCGRIGRFPVLLHEVVVNLKEVNFRRGTADSGIAVLMLLINIFLL